MSDEELSKEIERQLKEQGVNTVTVEFKTDENGRRQIRMECENPEKNPKDFELRIDDGNNQEVLKQKVKIGNDDKFKGKSDDEIRKMVREDLGNPDIKDNEIKIERDQNSDIKIKVEVDKKNN